MWRVGFQISPKTDIILGCKIQRKTFPAHQIHQPAVVWRTIRLHLFLFRTWSQIFRTVSQHLPCTHDTEEFRMPFQGCEILGVGWEGGGGGGGALHMKQQVLFWACSRWQLGISLCTLIKCFTMYGCVLKIHHLWLHGQCLCVPRCSAERQWWPPLAAQGEVPVSVCLHL